MVRATLAREFLLTKDMTSFYYIFSENDLRRSSWLR